MNFRSGQNPTPSRHCVEPEATKQSIYKKCKEERWIAAPLSGARNDETEKVSLSKLI
jgi:hypothetical protein